MKIGFVSLGCPENWERWLPTQAEEIDGRIYITRAADGAPKPGDFGEIWITKVGNYDLFGMLERVYPSSPTELAGASASRPAALRVVQ